MEQQFTSGILLRETPDRNYWKRAAEFSRALGFQYEAAVFPVTSFSRGLAVPDSMEKITDFNLPENEAEVPADYVASSDTAKEMPVFDKRKKRGLEELFSKGEFLKDRNLDQLPDEMDFQVAMPADADCFLWEAACNLAFRFGMETTAYEGPLLCEGTGDAAGKRNRVVFRKGPQCRIDYENAESGSTVTISGQGRDLVMFVSELCEHFPEQGPFLTLSDRMQSLAGAFSMRTLDGQLAYLKAALEREKAGIPQSAAGQDSDAPVKVYVDTDIDDPARRKAAEQAFEGVRFINYKNAHLEYAKDYDFSWEVDDLKKLLEKEVYPKIRAGQNIRIQAAVSEDLQVRSDLEKEILARLRELQVKDPQAEVLCAYKQGFSWISEKVVPELKKLQGMEKFAVRFKPFLPPGQTEWGDEDGATPTYNNFTRDPEKWYDFPIRYLQELYPVEDVIVSETGIDPDSVVFETYDGGEDITYEALALDGTGAVLYRASYRAECSERPYIDDFPEMGRVHPSTGYIRLWQDGRKTYETAVKTDVEKIWDAYQNSVLPEVRDYVTKKTGGKNLVSQQPFFETLKIEIEASEPDEQLSSREDLYSSLDGLHEDLYFVGSDYFKNYGLKMDGEITDAPGLILPLLKKRNGAPHMKVTLSSQQQDCPAILAGKRTVLPPEKQEAEVYIASISREKEGLNISVAVENVPDSIVESYAELLQAGVLDPAQQISGFDSVSFRTKGGTYRAELPKTEAPEKDLDIRDVDILDHEVIGYDQYIGIMEQLKRVKGLEVFPIAKSYKGRTMYGVTAAVPLQGHISLVKRISAHPSELINARHHANEDSSTNAAFLLIRRILTEKEFRDLPLNMNLGIVPVENVDGTAIHYMLQKENPYWKFHVARFNAIGKEFYYDMFLPDTMHTEAKGFRRMFMKYLPDIVVDNHGVPSHEWEQQFSGYTSPAYRGFWLPRSLLYGYFYCIEDDRYRSNYTLNRKMEDAIADHFLENKEVTDLNLLWARQFEKYAHQWMPKMFPADYYKNMIVYWIRHGYDPKHRYPSFRYPWILSVDYVSEVADETAQGDYLNQCARAHVEHDIATLRMILSASCIYDRSWNYSGDTVKAAFTRKRPIIAQ